MNRKRIKQKGPTPLMGRQLFRGQFAPLILANTSGISPSVYAAAYAASSDVIPNVEPMPIPPANVEPCPFSVEEAQVCSDNPDYPFCKKRRLAKSDPECSTAKNMECPLTQLLIDKCTNEGSEYGMFCTLQKQPLQKRQIGDKRRPEVGCIEDYLPIESADREKRREEQEEIKKRNQEELKESKRCIIVKTPTQTQTICPIPPEFRKDIDEFKKAADKNPIMGLSYTEYYLP
jgi:hypothetical protein